MNTFIEIHALNSPAIIFFTHGQSIHTNALFEDLFPDAYSREKFRVFVNNTLHHNEISSVHYAIVSLNDSEYFTTFMKMDPPSQYLITLERTKYLSKTLEDMQVVRNIENEFYNILGAMHDDFVIMDKNGVIIKVLPNFEAMYGISSKEAIGKTIYEMEEKKIFNPSVAIRVLKSKKAETMLQLTGANKYLMCTAIPVKDEYNQIEKIISYTRDVTKYQTLKEEYNKLEDTLEIYTAELEQLRNSSDKFPSIIRNSANIQNVVSTVHKISKFDATVLFSGESGVGKTMFAKLMHAQSNRNSGPFMEINCGAIPESLLESELFGYEQGAFSGASKEGKPGLIELANNGTLFLDEIGDLPLHMQVKLLKAIQEKKITRIGSSIEKNIDFRLISATNKDLDKMVKEGTFREDLFYRLNVITIHIPSLKERKKDIIPLCKHFVEKFNKKYNLNRTLSNIVLDYFLEYDWPGNIRELENVVERLILTSDDYMITEDRLPAAIKSHMLHNPIISNKSLKEILETVESKVIQDAYNKHRTSIGVAKELGISQPSASIKINKYVNSKQKP